MSITSSTESWVQAAQTVRADSWAQHIPRLLAFITIYFFLAFFRIGHQSLWVDEVFTAIAADPDRSFYDVGIWRLGSRPLYFTLLHLWAQLGDGEFVLRSFSAVVGGVGIVLVYVLGLRLFGPRGAAIGTVLFATSPFLIWYSQEVRYITLLITTSLFAMYAYHQALERERLSWWLSYCCALVLAIGAFLTNVLLILIHGFYLFSSPLRRKTLRLLLVCQFVVFVVFVWWANEWQHSRLAGYWNRIFHELTLEKQELISLSREQRFSRGGKRDFDLAAVPYTFFTLSAGFSLGPSVAELQTDRSVGALLPHAPVVLPVAVLFGGLFVAGLLLLRERKKKTLLLLGLWLTVPVAAACMVSALTHAAFNVRYVAMILPAFIFILTAGIMKLSSSRMQNAALGSVLLVNVFSLSNYYFNPRYAREDAREAAQFLAATARPQDVIVVVGSSVALRYYYTGGVPLRSWNWSEQNAHSDATAPLKELVNDHNRLWLVETRRWEKDRTGQSRKAAQKLYSLLNRQHFPGVEIYLFDTSQTGKARSLAAQTLSFNAQPGRYPAVSYALREPISR